MLQTKRRVLFMPWGNGNGHVVRSLRLAEEATAAGWMSVVTVPNADHEQLVKTSGARPVRYPSELVPSDLWGSWADPEFVRRSIDYDVALLDREQPDIVVHDGRVSANVAAMLTNTRSIGVIQNIHFPGHTYAGRGMEPLWPVAAAVFNQELTRRGRATSTSDLRDFITSSPILVPSIPQIDPIPHDSSVDSQYVGPITGYGSNSIGAAARELPEGAIFFYRTVSPDRIDEFRRAFADLSDRVYIAVGDASTADSLSNLLADDRFHVADLWRVSTERRPDVAVIHGGHGTALTMLQCGVPSVVIADQSPERLANARSLAKLGAAHVLRPEPDGSWDWRSSGRPEVHMRWSDVREACDLVIDDKSFQNAADDWSTRLRRFDLASAFDAVVTSARIPTLAAA